MVTSTPWLLEVLRAARDVDLAFFDPARLDPARDAEVERALTARLPGVPFNLVCRRNPRRVTVAHYRRRVRDKRIAERWPRVEVVL
jgi:hypothetical protein